MIGQSLPSKAKHRHILRQWPRSHKLLILYRQIVTVVPRRFSRFGLRFWLPLTYVLVRSRRRSTSPVCPDMDDSAATIIWDPCEAGQAGRHQGRHCADSSWMPWPDDSFPSQPIAGRRLPSVRPTSPAGSFQLGIAARGGQSGAPPPPGAGLRLFTGLYLLLPPVGDVDHELGSVARTGKRVDLQGQPGSDADT